LEVDESRVIKTFEGAEAILYVVKWIDGLAVVKKRIAKPYRSRVLDEELRAKRTAVEARAMKASLEAGVPAPTPYLVDLPGTTIVMEYIEGTTLADVIEDNPARGEEEMRVLGRITGMLHEANIAHGDLTTSNVIVAKKGSLVLIDFGLASLRADELDQAVDVHLLARSLEATHPHYSGRLLEAFMKGYGEVRGEKASKMLELVREIRLMGRYREERLKRRE